jgi:hypothetical protein
MSKYSTIFNPHHPVYRRAEASEATEEIILVTIAQAADALVLDETEVEQQIADGILSAIKVAGKVRVALSDLHSIRRLRADM